ncbi:MAG: crossover junction endodeoxyribonuclease RuvC [Cyanobacteria bacterium REEB67]|nr:crossover junction endodeoxyribonuclease RuvC [Cyanobacteria bacterium REEB67]
MVSSHSIDFHNPPGDARARSGKPDGKPVHRILGVDPGTATVGFGIVDWVAGDTFKYICSGVISTPKTMAPGMRLKMIREDLLEILSEFGADHVAVEAIFFFKNAKTLVPVAQARGVIMEVLSTFGLTPGEYTPMQVKLHLTGYGKAEKPEVQWAVAKLLGLPEIIKPDDASDALAIAVTHARMATSVKMRL